MCRFEIKHVSGLGHQSPPRGGGQGGAANQQILVSGSEEGSEGTIWHLPDSYLAPTLLMTSLHCILAFMKHHICKAPYLQNWQACFSARWQLSPNLSLLGH